MIVDYDDLNFLPDLNLDSKLTELKELSSNLGYSIKSRICEKEAFCSYSSFLLYVMRSCKKLKGPVRYGNINYLIDNLQKTTIVGFNQFLLGSQWKELLPEVFEIRASSILQDSAKCDLTNLKKLLIGLPDVFPRVLIEESNPNYSSMFFMIRLRRKTVPKVSNLSFMGDVLDCQEWRVQKVEVIFVS